MRAASHALAALSLLAALAPAPAGAQETGGEPPAAVEGDTLGWHLVRPGDTLRGITASYLGTDALWRDNWGLNPTIRDPDLLFPGQRLRVILDRKLPGRTAEVAKVSRRVDAKPQPNPWLPAREGDQLRESDGVRTFARSSAELSFDDGTRLQLTEDSLVFLRRLGATLTGGREETIEVVDGQADLAIAVAGAAGGAGAAGAAGTKPSDIEIVIGGTTARPQAGPGGVGESRARRAGGESGAGAQLMVYRGRSEVESAGARVAVPPGMGTSVPEGGPPSPPERLLTAPTLAEPEAGAQRGWANPAFAWRPVAGAASYVIEVCADRQCGRLTARTLGLEEPRWQPAEALPVGDLHWRVTAVAPSGLDGYPSPTRPLAVTSDLVDLAPPAVVAVRVGAGRLAAEGPVVLGEGGGLVPAAHDDASGVAEVRYRWDGGSWQRWTSGPLAPPGAGAHTLELTATDRLGRESEPVTIEVEADPEPPAPPGIAARGHHRGDPG